MYLGKSWVILLLLCVGILGQLPAGQTDAFVGISGSYRYAEDPSSPVHGATVDLQGNLGHRMLLGETGFLGFSLYSTVSLDPATYSVSDHLLAGITNSWFFDAGVMEFAVEVDQSFFGSDGGSAFTVPSWSASYGWERGYRTINPFVQYRGSATSGGSQHGLELGFSYSPSVELTYSTTVGGTYATSLPDFLATIAFGAEGLVGYLFNWEFGAEAAYRFAEDPTDESLSLRASALFGYTPSRRMHIRFSPALAATRERASGAWTIDGEALLRADVAIKDDLYWYVETGAFSSLVQDTVPTWYVQVRTGVDVSF